MSPPRALLLVLVAAVVLGAFGACARRTGEGPPVEAAPGTSPRAAAGAVGVLRAWDVRRARAWAAGDQEALFRLYTPASAAGRRDVRMLRSWVERGLRVHGMRMQVLAVRVREEDADRLVLVVTDRLVRAVAVGPGVRLVLPRDGASTRVLTLRRVSGEWRVRTVRETGRGWPAQPAR